MYLPRFSALLAAVCLTAGGAPALAQMAVTPHVAHDGGHHHGAHADHTVSEQTDAHADHSSHSSHSSHDGYSDHSEHSRQGGYSRHSSGHDADAASVMHGGHDVDALEVHDESPPTSEEVSTPLLRDPHAYSNGLRRGEGIYVPAGMPHLMMADEHRFAALRVDTLERRFARKGQDSTAYGLKAWYGNSYDKLLLKAEGDFAKEKLEDARTELLWVHAMSPFWDTQLGIRLDHGEGPGRQWLAAGVEGLAPYWFDLEATAYLGSGGRTALRLEASYELLLTQRLILAPKVEMQLYGKDDPGRGLGRGLAHASASLRLRYELTREFAPYVGVDWVGSFGQTADNKRAAGMSARQTRWVAGLRFWF